MAWETRKNGRRYYTKSYREDGRVCRRYVPLILAPMVAEADQEARDRRERERAERERLREEDRAFRKWYQDVQDAMNATLEAAGYHRHKGQWRKRRNPTNGADHGE